MEVESDAAHDGTVGKLESTMRVAVLTGLVITVTTAASIGFGYTVHGNLNAYYGLLSLFFCINLPICYWEICLFLRRGRR